MSEISPTGPPPLPRSAWSFLTIVAVGVALTVATHFARLPTGARGYYNRGVADRRAGRLDAAIENFDRAIAIDPAWSLAYVGRAVAWNSSGQPFHALADIRAALDRAPKSSLAFYVRGLALQRIGHEDAALESFDRALQLDPGSGRFALARGDVYFDRGSFPEALVAHRRAWSLRKGEDELRHIPTLIWASRVLAGGNEEPADGEVEKTAWTEAVRTLAAGHLERAVNSLRAVAASAPADSWEHARAWSLLENLTIGFRVLTDNREISESLSFGAGVAIACVRPGGAAERAGLAAGDRLERIGRLEATQARVDGLVVGAAIGAAIELEIVRRGERRTVTLVPGDPPPLRSGVSAPTR